MPRLFMTVEVQDMPLAHPFRITGFTFESMPAVVVTLDDGEVRGRGEGSGVYYLGDDLQHMLSELDAHRAVIEDGTDRETLRGAMPAGGARNAVDCALWELEARRAGRTPREMAGLDPVRPLVTTFTLGAEEPSVMADGARGYAHARAIKLKLTGDADLDGARVRAVRAVRPDVWMAVDANQGYSIGDLDRLVPALVEVDVKLLEQPLPRGREADLDGYDCPLPIAADESALVLDDVPGLVGRFQTVNIKLDKCGGLTEGLLIAREARRLGLDVMVGNMVGTSLSMAPAFLVGQLCDVVDLDGPTFLKADRTPGARYEDGTIWVGEEVWGGPALADA